MSPKLPPDEVSTAYDVWADVYDSQTNATRDLDAIVLHAQDPALFQGDVLEIGCGTGKNTEWLAPRARSVLALDGSENMLKRARQRPGVQHVRFLQHDLRETWPAPDASFDTVTCNLVLEHIEGLSFVFSEAKRVLRPGGSFFVCELHPLRQLQGKQAHFMNPQTGTLQMVRAHLHDISDYLNAALSAGLVLAQAQDCRDASDPRTGVPRLLALRWRKP
ncbi:class I SAM-dependent DNA methyltransferase [Hyalangium versicolor]|uniref:class I SAM-dependent DNA methyltransferase n=1 Tax=Hyalangium versicolor TaxID=2861190 RepID=UPI001CCF218E|nr:class I SAM-dependent methyltransferase [Hyalangium versicolor]